ncbi:hypothetical protein L5M37_04675 [Shewanella sp. SM69]|uniref:hypothetical protein n=1 Tax=Shewanella sp. SM69 TaxID=2912802 RepID=UPI0021D8D990|nr:hypothetical protein [Shewanella sp. SM69]MCU8037785.1 hypothetical protein [Shewanella sp. SM69]
MLKVDGNVLEVVQGIRNLSCEHLLIFINTGLPWCSLTDSQLVRPWMLDRPVHGADGRLANHHGLPF